MMAFDFANLDGYGGHEAVINKADGKVYYRSDMVDMEEDEAPEGVWDSPDALYLPDKWELDLGTDLVLEFVESAMPEEYERVAGYFRKRGAYGRFKEFLASKDLLDVWHDFENKAQEKAMHDWCEENGVEVDSGVHYMTDSRAVKKPGKSR